MYVCTLNLFAVSLAFLPSVRMPKFLKSFSIINICDD